MNEILCTDIVDKLENSDYNSLFSYEKNDFSIFIKSNNLINGQKKKKKYPTNYRSKQNE